MILLKGDIVEVAELRVFGATRWRGGVITEIEFDRVLIQLLSGDFGGATKSNERWFPIKERWRQWR